MDSASAAAQYAAELVGEGARKNCGGAEEGKELPVPVYVRSGREQDGRRACLCCQVLREGRQESGGLPRQCFEGVARKVLTTEADEVRPFVVGRGAENRRARGQLLRHCCPVHFVKGGAVAPHHDDLLVSLRKGVGDGVREARSEPIAPLLRIGDLQDGQSAVRHGLPGVLEERPSHLPVFRHVLPHELLVLPLALGAVAEKQEGGMGVGSVDRGRLLH